MSFRPRMRGPGRQPSGSRQSAIQGAKDVVIQDVQLKLENDPLSSRTYLRSVPAKDQRVGTGDWLPIGSRVGTPEHFADPPHVGRGEFTDSKGARVTAPCGPDKSANAFQELVTVMEIGEAGARSNELEVNYTADGTPAVLVVPYTYVACGTAISDPDYCRPESWWGTSHHRPSRATAGASSRFRKTVAWRPLRCHGPSSEFSPEW